MSCSFTYTVWEHFEKLQHNQTESVEMLVDELLKKKMVDFEEKLQAYYGPHERAIAVGEAQDLMDSDPKPVPTGIHDANMDNANARAVNSRHKHTVIAENLILNSTS